MHSPKQDSRVGALRSISLRAWVVGAIFAAASLHSNAAGLGRLDVKSVLGEPLRAEVSVLAKPGEVRSLEVRLAPPQAYQAAGLVHTLIVSKLAVSLGKDASGQPVVNITSAGPINEPVIDLLLELSWSSGRVTREYTAFIDPPFIVAEREKRRVEAAVAAAEAEEAARGAETQAATAPTSPTPEALPEEPVADAAEDESVASAEEVVVEDLGISSQETDLGPVETIGGTGPTLFGATPTLSSPGASDAYVSSTDQPIGVIRGDTLSKIALANKPAGVTLEQMLVVLYRNNQQAFSGNNMNRLRTGKIIRLADRDEYEQISAADARKEVRVQSTNWKAYKERLAAATMQQDVTGQTPQQAAGGAVTPKLEEQAATPSGTTPEVVKLSRGEPAAAGQGSGQGNTAAMQEKLVASEKALKESNERVTRLEKIIEDLQKLAEVKNQDMAELQNQAGGATKPTPVPQQGAQPAKPETATTQPPAPAATAQTIQPSPDTAAPAKSEKMDPKSAATGETGMETPAKVPPASTTGEAPKTAPQATQKPRRRPAPPPPPPPPSLLDRAFAQPYLLAIPLVLILLVGWGVSRLRGRNREPKEHSDESAPAFSDSGEAASAPGTFSPVQTDVGLAGKGGDGEEVDPLEEAEIFLAYGRDAQAEELLQEAIAVHPTRFEIHLKLLEIYARQNNIESFEKLARDIQQNAGSEGEIWERVVKLGYSIDPGNPRYAEGAGAEGDEGNEDGASDDGLASTDMSATTERLDFDVGIDDDAGASATTETDIDLGANRDFEKTQIMDTPTIDVTNQSAAIDSDMDADLPTLDHGASALDLSVDEGGNAVDFDFDSDKTLGQVPATEQPDELAASGADSGLDFDVNEMSFGAGGEEQGDASNAPALDLSGISLDLDGATTNQMGASSKDDKWYEVQTKFDLAKAYQEMGDNDGAREILKEVISEGDTEQKAAAENVLSSLE